MTRAYLWIAALTGCNGIFGLDDDAKFVLPDAPDAPLPADSPLPPTLKTCLTESFDSLDSTVWDDLKTPEAMTYSFSGGAFQIEAMGPFSPNRVGVGTKEKFDLTGGAIEITVVDPSTVDAEGGIAILFDDDFVAFTSRKNTLFTESKKGLMLSQVTIQSTDRQLRLGFNPDTGEYSWESAPSAGDPYTPQFTTAGLPVPRQVRIAVFGRQDSGNANDTILLDDLRVTALCQ